MRISDLSGQRLWTTGLILAIAIGSYGVAEGQVQSSLQQAQPNPTLSKIETWLADARQAVQDGKADEAKQYLQVAESIANQPGVQLPAGFSFDNIKAEIAQMSATNQVAPSGDSDIAARNALLQARRALAQGDIAKTQSFVDQAKTMQVDFDRLGDSPQSVEAMIAKQKELLEMQNGNDADAFNHAAGLFFVEQGKALMAYRDWKTAEGILNLAKSFPADYASNNIDVDALLAEVKTGSAAIAVEAQMVQAQPQAPTAKESAMKLLSQAQLAMDQDRWADADKLVAQAKSLNVPDSEFAPGQTRPWQMELIVKDKLNKMNAQAPIVSGVAQSSATIEGQPRVVQADYVPESDQSRIVQVAGTDDESVANNYREFNPIPSRGMQLYRAGLQAMDDEKFDDARDRFETALQYRDQLDQATITTIRGHLTSLSGGNAVNPGFQSQIGIDDEQSDLFRRLQSEVFKERSDAERMLESSPRKALEKMTMIRNKITDSELNPSRKKPLVTIIDRQINDMQQYIELNLSEIINTEQNQRNMEIVERRRQDRIDTEQQIQALTQDFNRLMDQGRWAEAEAIASQATDLDPDSEIVVLLSERARLAAQQHMMQEARQLRADRNQLQLGINLERSATAIDDRTPLEFGPDHEDWIQRSQMRLQRLQDRQYNSAEERRIWNALNNTKVQGDFTGTLNDAIDVLSQQSGINIVFDRVALEATGARTNSPVAANIREPISLKSALNVVLGDHQLVFVVEDEVIKVTSKEAQRQDLKVRTYYVGDLVTPINPAQNPLQMNFITPSQSYNTQNSVLASNNSMHMTMPQQMAANNGRMNTVSMGQQLPNSPFGGQGMYGPGYNDGPNRGMPMYTSTGAPQLGGVTEADFDNLIDLIKSTIAPDDWDDTNGDGSIQAFVPNLSLIVSNTQQVQDQIQDLLEKLRELNDVQIVVEVRFIILTDNFFERVGIDFDFRLNDNSGLNPATLPDEVQQSSIIGREPVSNGFTPTGDLDVAFGQNSFASAIPQFGGFDAATAANFGFAILSDIEVFFLIQASKGDSRSNVTQAPVVTMFNGQSASVNDGAQRPFVTSVVPVVGDFAVAHQPVISLLPDGTSLNVQAVVSPDRRFVRLSLVPFFSQVTDVETFTFSGSRTTRNASDSLLQDLLNQAGLGNNNLQELETVDEGTTIQLPVISFTTVNTVVSVPDGGTVLMGGVKRMSEGRTERGVPFLSNVPYANRLFKNVGIGRETQNLMMMVTPRIIIQEEEENFQVGPIGGN